MAKIFICYRSDDASGEAERIYDTLAERFGTHSIFVDMNTLEPGEDADGIKQVIESCQVMLALIGTQWLDMPDDNGCRRIDDPSDWVRLEIATALEKKIRVIPVLLRGARIPEKTKLPADIAKLSNMQKFDIRRGHFRGDINQLIQLLEKILKPQAQRQGPAQVNTELAAIRQRASKLEPALPEPLGLLLIEKGNTDAPFYVLRDSVTMMGKSPMASIRMKGLFAPDKAALIHKTENNKYSIEPEAGIKLKVNGLQIVKIRPLAEWDVIEVGSLKALFHFQVLKRRVKSTGR
jgi:TIR domain-containing protein